MKVVTFGRAAGGFMDRMHATAAVIATLGLFGLAAIIALNVLLRLGGGGGIRGIVEIVEVVVVVIAYFAIGVAQREGQHVTITVATASFSSSLQERVTRLGLAIGLIYVAFLVWHTGVLAFNSYGEAEARWGLVSVPVWPGRIVVCCGYMMLGLELVRQVVIKVPGRSA